MKTLIIWLFIVFVGIQIGLVGFDCLQASITADIEKLHTEGAIK